MTNEKKGDEKVERFVGGYQARQLKKEEYCMSQEKNESKKIEIVIEGYQPKAEQPVSKDTQGKRGYQPQSSGEQPQPPQSGTGAQKPKK